MIGLPLMDIGVKLSFSSFVRFFGCGTNKVILYSYSCSIGSVQAFFFPST